MKISSWYIGLCQSSDFWNGQGVDRWFHRVPPLSATHDSREWQWNNDADVEDPTFILPIQHCGSCTDIRRGIITVNWGLLIGPRRGGPAGSAGGSRAGRAEEGGRAKGGQGLGRRTRCGRSVWDRRSRELRERGGRSENDFVYSIGGIFISPEWKSVDGSGVGCQLAVTQWTFRW